MYTAAVARLRDGSVSKSRQARSAQFVPGPGRPARAHDAEQALVGEIWFHRAAVWGDVWGLDSQHRRSVGDHQQHHGLCLQLPQCEPARSQPRARAPAETRRRPARHREDLQDGHCFECSLCCPRSHVQIGAAQRGAPVWVRRRASFVLLPGPVSFLLRECGEPGLVSNLDQSRSRAALFPCESDTFDL